VAAGHHSPNRLPTGPLRALRVAAAGDAVLLVAVAASAFWGRLDWALALVPTHGTLTTVVALTLAWFAHTRRVDWKLAMAVTFLGAAASLPALAATSRE
jgi:hypothetical protein